MKNTIPCIRTKLCSAVVILLAGCGAGSQGGLSNGPQIAAMTVASLGPAAQLASEPAAPEPAPAALPAPPAPEPATADQPSLPAPAGGDSSGAGAPPASGAKADVFALSGYGASESAGSSDAGAGATPPDNAAPVQAPSPPICKYGGCSFR